MQAKAEAELREIEAAQREVAKKEGESVDQTKRDVARKEAEGEQLLLCPALNLYVITF